MKKNALTQRNAEMVRLRLEERLSITVIGQRYGISKQRVQQIIGKTGHMDPRRDLLVNRITS